MIDNKAVFGKQCSGSVEVTVLNLVQASRLVNCIHVLLDQKTGLKFIEGTLELVQNIILFLEEPNSLMVVA